MLTTTLRSALLALVALSFAFALPACDSGGDEPAPSTTGTVTGRFTLPAGANGSLQNARVFIYTSQAELNQDSPLTSTAAGADGSYTISNLNPGNYYLDVFKDNDNSGGPSNGDFYGVYTTTGPAAPFAVVANQTTTVSGNVIVVNFLRPGNADAQPSSWKQRIAK